MKTEGAKTRLVQQMAKLSKLEEELKADLSRISAEARVRLTVIDKRLDQIRPVLEKWKKADFQPETDALRQLAQEYVDLIRERQDTLYAEAEPEQSS